jgi:crossover junction endodeoxyribonuclease RuvC
MPKQTILGIDPGFAITGYGVLELEGGKFTCLDYGCIETKCGENFSARLQSLHHLLTKVIKKYRPDCAAVEEIFFAKNLKTAIKVSQARGVILLTLINNKIPALEFTPLQVKQAISTYGRADKKQVQQMVKLILNLKVTPQPDDAADALAIAIAAANARKLMELKYKNS